MVNKIQRMKELIQILNEASEAYYQKNQEIMSNFEYDKLYDELGELEKDTKTVLSNSPTVHVGYELLTNLEKEAHPSPMLSLDKTKEVDALASWLGNQKGLLSWKLDGLTVVLTYENGELSKAVTRGNGEIGEVITNNAKVFVNLPRKIAYENTLVIRGEAVILYSDFKKMNEEMPDVESQYKNPRNLCSGSVRQLNNEITAQRKVHFYGFSVGDVGDVDFHNSMEKKIAWARELGFDMVDYKAVTSDTISDAVQDFADKMPEHDAPSDGLVLLYDDIAYGRSLGRTAKFPRDSIAFKWADETAKTKLTEIEWSPSRTGLINPVAIFDPVELEGTTVSRASLHNLSVMGELELGIGDDITVYKANMIIPQLAENFTKSNHIDIPKTCPACGGQTKVESENGIKTLVCTNEFCSAKKLKLFSHFVSRDALNVDGLSEATLDKMIQGGMLEDLYDIFTLEQYKDTIINMEGFGEKSYENLISAIHGAKTVLLPNFIYSLGIANVGLSNAKLICSHFEDDFDAIRKADVDDFIAIDGIGPMIGQAMKGYFALPNNQKTVDKLLEYLDIQKREKSSAEKILEGKVFVITGSLNEYTNRKALKEHIEELGGKVTGSVTGKTDYLINNDTTSTSSKNKKAKDLGVSIISEEDFIEMIKA
ncbi:MAG: NAD-dependent DNA ligase LigA [Anaerostipes sp.]|jgi:DNA ligase (NAD+)